MASLLADADVDGVVYAVVASAASAQYLVVSPQHVDEECLHYQLFGYARCLYAVNEVGVVQEYSGGLARRRILMGSEAYDAGLVDELGSEEEVMAAVRRLTKGEGRPQVIRYESPMDWRGILKFFAQSHTPGVVKVELNGLNINGSSVMEPGKLYFLPPGE